ncbi:nicotinate phosphoribosyltransferase [candidate division KSB1 bacterium]|nr:nicotinate phosphoribosyltransferase [candidate division KSB1 bacterium]
MYQTNKLALLTDLYELTMMQGYFLHKQNSLAVFDMFFRRQPHQSGFTIFAGLDPLLDLISELRFCDDDIHYLQSTGIFSTGFLDYLRTFKFTGDIYAAPEGSVVFPNEPILRVHGTLLETQLIESMVLNFINFQTLIATKSMRINLAANEGKILEFGLRRAQGMDGALSATRAAVIGGASSTSNVLAGKLYKVPISGTMAHSWIMSFNSEIEAFQTYADMYPDNCVLLVDTYDTLNSGVPNAIQVFKKLKAQGHSHFGIRLDSGDLEYLSKKARTELDKNDLKEAKIYASNELDEWIITQLIKDGAPIDAWGVGTKLVTGDTDPALTGVYKIVAKKTDQVYEPCIKITNNPEKMSNPGIKNVMRFFDQYNNMIADLIYLEEEEQKLLSQISAKAKIRFNHPTIEFSFFELTDYAYAIRLLEPVLSGEKRETAGKSLFDIQRFAIDELNKLDTTYKRLLNPHIYKISLSDNLKKLKYDLINKMH